MASLPKELREVQLAGAPLSPTERQILRALAKGWTVPAIAESRGKSPNTYKCHVKSLRAKLQADTIAHAVAIAIAEEII